MDDLETSSDEKSATEVKEPYQPTEDPNTSIQHNEEEEIYESFSQFDLSDIFLWRDKTPKMIERGQFEEAFGVLEQRHRLSEELRDAPLLLKYCESLMATENDYEDAKSQLKLLLVNLRCSYDTVFWLATKLMKLKRYFGAFVMHEIFYEMFYDINDSGKACEVIEKCISGMKQTVTSMVEKNDSLNIFVCRRILPKMYEMKNTFWQIEDINQQYKCVKYGWITHAVEICETDSQKRRDLILKTIEHMREVLGERVKKHQIFGTLCNNLGSSYLRLGNHDEAIKYYLEAIECFKSATDYQREHGRDKDLKSTERALLGAQGLEDEIGVQFGRKKDTDPLSELLKALF